MWFLVARCQIEWRMRGFADWCIDDLMLAYGIHVPNSVTASWRHESQSTGSRNISSVILPVRNTQRTVRMTWSDMHACMTI